MQQLLAGIAGDMGTAGMVARASKAQVGGDLALHRGRLHYSAIDVV